MIVFILFVSKKTSASIFSSSVVRIVPLVSDGSDDVEYTARVSTFWYIKFTEDVDSKVGLVNYNFT